MAIIEGFTGTQAEVDAPSRAQRVTQRPMPALAWNSIGAMTGLLTAVAANGCIFSFRNISANLILVRQVSVGFMTTSAFTAAQALDYGLFVARAFTTNDGAGTEITQLGNNCKHRTSLSTPTSIHCRISTTAALTAGSRTLDTNALGVIGGGSAGLATGLQLQRGNLFDHIADDMPLVLAQNEGLAINNLTLMGAAGAVRAYVNFEYAEIASY